MAPAPMMSPAVVITAPSCFGHGRIGLISDNARDGRHDGGLRRLENSAEQQRARGKYKLFSHGFSSLL
jgi:hypothetical protein